MPYALSHTGAAVGLLTMLLVALCNDYTSMLMVAAAYETGLDSFEGLALWAGGPKWKVSRAGVKRCPLPLMRCCCSLQKAVQRSVATGTQMRAVRHGLFEHSINAGRSFKWSSVSRHVSCHSTTAVAAAQCKYGSSHRHTVGVWKRLRPG